MFTVGPLAQSVEQRTFNPWVVGSIPTGPTSLASPRELQRVIESFLSQVSLLFGLQVIHFPDLRSPDCGQGENY